MSIEESKRRLKEMAEQLSGKHPFPTCPEDCKDFPNCLSTVGCVSKLQIVLCDWCSWHGYVGDLTVKHLAYPVEEGVPACPRCGSHQHLEYMA